MYHNRTPYLGLLILLHSFAATGITCRRRRRTTQTGTKRKAIFFPSLVRPFCCTTFFFFWHSCMYTPRSYCYHHQHHRRHQLCIILGFCSLVLGAPFSGFRSSFSQLQLIDNTHAWHYIYKDRILVSSLGAYYYCMLVMYILLARIQTACF
jgi:hypothetical protein